MFKVRSLKERWFEGKWRDLHRSYRANHDAPETFNSQLDKAIARAVWLVAQDAAQKKSMATELNNVNDLEVDAILRSLNLHHNYLSSDEYSKIKTIYKRVWEHNKNLKEDRHQENWANTMDHLKVVLYRTASAFLIGFVILFMSMLAHQMDIPFAFVKVG